MHVVRSQTRVCLKLVPAMHAVGSRSAVTDPHWDNKGHRESTLVPSLQESGQGQGNKAQSGSRRIRTERQRSRQQLDTKFRSHFRQVGGGACVCHSRCMPQECTWRKTCGRLRPLALKPGGCLYSCPVLCMPPDRSQRETDLVSGGYRTSGWWSLLWACPAPGNQHSATSELGLLTDAARVVGASALVGLDPIG